MTASSQALINLPQSCDTDIRPMVEAELDRILLDPLFKDTTRMKRFLTYVVTESLAGRDKRLKGYAIGLEVFDRPDDFDPQADTIVRVQAGQLRRRLDLFYAGEGKDSKVRILIPKGRYAPVFEIRQEADEAVIAPAAQSSGHAEVWKANRPGIAVMTFQNLTVDDDTGYFAEGITAEVINALVQFRYIRIVARTASVLNDARVPSDLKDIGEKYNVQFALTGNVRRAGQLLRVSVNLISVETGEHVYSKIFDRQYTPENIFEIQEEIASYVAASVAAPFGAVNRYNRRGGLERFKSMSAYEALLKYYDISISPTRENVTELLDIFDEVVKATPQFSSAWAVISMLNIFLVTQSLPSDSPKERLQVARKAAARAAAINPENGLAYNALFQVHYHLGNSDTAEEMAAKAIMLNPNDYNMLAYYAVTCAFQGQCEKARTFLDAALELVARPPAWFYTSAIICSFFEKNFEGVLSSIGEFSPQSNVAIQFMALASLGHLSRHEDASKFIKEANQVYGDYAQAALATIQHSYLHDDLYTLFIDGWRKAGLDIP